MDGPTPTPQQEPQTFTAEQVNAMRAQLVDEITGGKYGGDVTKAKEGFWNLTNYASQAMTALQQVDQRVNPGAIAAARPAEPANDPWGAVKNDYYGDSNALREAVRAEAAAMVAEAFQPIQQSVAARQNIQRDLPDYVTNEQAVIGWLEQNPQLYRMVYDVQASGHPEAAMRLAYGEYNRAHAGSASAPNKSAAAIPQAGGATPPTMQAANQSAQFDWVTAIKRANATGNDRDILTRLYADYNPQLPPHLQG